MGWTTEESEIVSRQRHKAFLFSTASTLSLRLIRPPEK
jgi:hypothetical protein